MLDRYPTIGNGCDCGGCLAGEVCARRDWRPIETGGNCTALESRIDQRHYALLTDGDYHAPSEDPSAHCVACVYVAGDDDEEIAMHEGTRAECEAWIVSGSWRQ